ncbi:MAG: hypothetical protein AAF587_24555 [Bacteroidota bacterium]
MAKPNYISFIRQLIAKNELAEALQQLQGLLGKHPNRNEVLIQSSKYAEIMKMARVGVLDFSESSREKTAIRQGLLELLDELERDALKEEKKAPSPQMAGLGFTVSRVWLIIALLVAIGICISLWMATRPLQLTVFVTDAKGNVVLENQGELNIPLGNRSLNSRIGDDGRTNFGDITGVSKGEKIRIGLEAEGWEIADGNNEFIFTGEPIHLIVQRDNSLGIVKGTVMSRDGSTFLERVEVSINGDTSIYTNQQGRFRIILPLHMRVKSKTERYRLFYMKEGYEPTDEYYSITSAGADIRMDPK